MPDGPVLKMTEAQFAALRGALLRPCGREHKLYAEVGRSACGFVVTRLTVPGDGDYVERSRGLVHIKPEWMMRILVEFGRGLADGILEAHSHPFCSHASFSSTDDRYIDGVREDFQRKRPGSDFLRLVVGQDPAGFSLEAFDTASQSFRPMNEIVIVGPGGIDHLPSSVSQLAPTLAEDSAYQRCACVRTPAEHARIRQARIVVVGAGGTGWMAAQLLSCLGVGDLTLVDPDLVEEANLNRLVGVIPNDVANETPKVERLAAILRAHDPSRRITPLVERFPSRRSVEAVQRADAVVCAVDHPPSRLNILRLCARHLVPALDIGSSIYLDEARTREHARHAHAWLYVPGGPCWLHMGLSQQPLETETLRAARQAAGYVVDDPRQSPGSVQTLNAAIAAMGLTLLEAYLAGRRPLHCILLYEEAVSPHLQVRIRQFGVAADPSCPLCGVHGVVGLGGDPFETDLGEVPLVLPEPVLDATADASQVQPSDRWLAPAETAAEPGVLRRAVDMVAGWLDPQPLRLSLRS